MSNFIEAIDIKQFNFNYTALNKGDTPHIEHLVNGSRVLFGKGMQAKRQLLSQQVFNNYNEMYNPNTSVNTRNVANYNGSEAMVQRNTVAALEYNTGRATDIGLTNLFYNIPNKVIDAASGYLGDVRDRAEGRINANADGAQPPIQPPTQTNPVQRTNTDISTDKITKGINK